MNQSTFFIIGMHRRIQDGLVTWHRFAGTFFFDGLKRCLYFFLAVFRPDLIIISALFQLIVLTQHPVAVGQCHTYDMIRQTGGRFQCIFHSLIFAGLRLFFQALFDFFDQIFIHCDAGTDIYKILHLRPDISADRIQQHPLCRHRRFHQILIILIFHITAHEQNNHTQRQQDLCTERTPKMGLIVLSESCQQMFSLLFFTIFFHCHTFDMFFHLCFFFCIILILQ